MTNNQRPTRRQLDDLQQDAPGGKAGAPDDRWTSEELLAYIEAQDSEIAALEPVGALLPLEALADQDLQELASALTHENVQAIQARIRARLLKKGATK